MSPPDARRPLTIAHRAGNDLAALAEAFAAGVDYAEADVWLFRGRLEVRHDKTGGPLPFLWERWSLKPAWTPRLLLREVLAEAAGKGRLFIDLKGQADALVKKVAAAVSASGAEESVAFSTPEWSHLDRIAKLLPQAPLFYTIGSLARLEERRPRLQQGAITALSVQSRILTAELVSEFREMGVNTIVTWGIETADDAQRVLEWGVSGVTSRNLSLLVSLHADEVPRD